MYVELRDDHGGRRTRIVHVLQSPLAEICLRACAGTLNCFPMALYSTPHCLLRSFYLISLLAIRERKASISESVAYEACTSYPSSGGV